MSLVAGALMVIGGAVAVLAGVGLIKFDSSLARLHAAGKASPISFLIAALGAGVELGFGGAVYLALGAAAMTLTLPVGVHLLFRAVYRTGTHKELSIDELGAEVHRGNESVESESETR